MRRWAGYLVIFVPAILVTWAVLMPRVPHKSGPFYVTLGLLIWALLLTFPLWIRWFERVAIPTLRAIRVDPHGVLPALKVSMLTLVTLSCALVTQAVWYPTLQGPLAVIVGSAWATLDLTGKWS